MKIYDFLRYSLLIKSMVIVENWCDIIMWIIIYEIILNLEYKINGFVIVEYFYNVIEIIQNLIW
jgi:hypothetical protein